MKPFAFLAFFIFIPLLFSADPMTQRTTAFQTSYGEWFPIIAITLFISLFVTAIAFITAEILQSAPAKAWVKEELYEVLTSFFYAGMIVSSAIVMKDLSLALVGADPFTFAEDYIRTIFSDFAQAYFLMLQGEYIIGVVSSWSWYFEVYRFISIGVSPFAGYNEVFNAYMRVIDPVGIIMISNVGHLVLLDFARDHALSFFLPLGILMRAFPFTRKIGTTLMVIAVAGFFIYPLTLSFNNVVYTYLKQKPPFYGRSPLEIFYVHPASAFLSRTIGGNSLLPEEKAYLDMVAQRKAQLEKEASLMSNNTVGGKAKQVHVQELQKAREAAMLDGTDAASAKTRLISFTDAILALLSSATFFAGVDNVFNLLLDFLDMLMYMVVVALGLTIIDIILVVSFVRSLAIAMGGETQLVGFEKIM